MLEKGAKNEVFIRKYCIWYNNGFNWLLRRRFENEAFI